MGQLETYYQDPKLLEAQQKAQTVATQASAYKSAASLLPQRLREAIMSKVEYNQDIIEQKNKAMAEYFQAPSAAREKYQNIWDPFQREKLVAEERAQAYLPYANLVDILGQRMGTIEDIINAGTGAFQSQVLAQQGEAQIARQNWEDLLTLAKLKEEARRAGQIGADEGSSIEQIIEMIELLKGVGGDEGMHQTPGGTAIPGITPYSYEGRWVLMDPSTGKLYEYDGPNDPDYKRRIKEGWYPQ